MSKKQADLMPSFPSPTATWHRSTYPAIDPTRPELSLKGKTIIITGGGTGIGAETALYFAKAGASKIVILGRREQPLLDTKASIQKAIPGVEIITASVDVTNKSQVDATFSKIFGSSGKIDVLVSNAGFVGPVKTIKDVDPDVWFEGVEKNLKMSLYIAKAFLLYSSPNGVFINVSSAVAHVDMAPAFSSYAVGKLAAARYLGALQYENPGLRVFSIQPGMVLTDMSRESGFTEGLDDANLPASFMVWLASEEARFLNGKFLWTNWDVEELKAQQKDIEGSGRLSITLGGWPFEHVIQSGN